MTRKPPSTYAQEPDRKSLRRQCLLAIGLSMVACSTLEFGIAMLVGFSVATGLALSFAVACLVGLIMAKILRQPRGVPVLTYHSVSDKPDWLPWSNEISIRPATLDRQLRLFRRMGLKVVDCADMVEMRQSGTPVPDTAIVVHFDDGYLDTWAAAWPILKRHGARATVFVSTDFIAPDQPMRPTIENSQVPQWDGYMTWRELRALEADGTFRVEAHGTDHGRVVIGPRKVARLTRDNVREMSWMQWARMPGNKHDWYLRTSLPVPLGSPVLESAPSLSARLWSPEAGKESGAAYDTRISGTFAACQNEFQRELGRRSTIFCWPQNRACTRGRELAEEAGFVATTGGTGRNVADSDPSVISRIHIGEDYAGFRCGWIDDLAVRAQIRCFQGYSGWSVALAAIGLTRRAVKLIRRVPVPHLHRHIIGQEGRAR